jgi:L-alanine-DL-glutamate epimerase-like enolase superfamily enzyme
MAVVQIRQFRFQSLAIPFKTTFRHASAERAESSTVWIEAVGNGLVGRGESCPRPYVTGESVDGARLFFDEHEAAIRAAVHDLTSLREWMEEHGDQIDRHPAAWCAMELAMLDLLAQHAGLTIESLLGLAPLTGRFSYTAVLGDMGADAFRALAVRYRALGLTDFKVKLSGDRNRDREKLALLRDWPDARVRVDANNLWPDADEATDFLTALDVPLFAVEEPIRPGQYELLANIAARVGCKVVLDESLSRLSQIVRLGSDPATWLINLRVSKMGGLLRSLEVAGAARAAGVGLVVGAQVGETSLLTRVALTVAHASRDILVAQEGAFGTMLLEHDVCHPPLMFGAGGVLDVASYEMLARPGFGLADSGSSWVEAQPR